jgi:hypothetical protein
VWIQSTENTEHLNEFLANLVVLLGLDRTQQDLQEVWVAFVRNNHVAEIRAELVEGLQCHLALAAVALILERVDDQRQQLVGVFVHLSVGHSTQLAQGCQRARGHTRTRILKLGKECLCHTERMSHTCKQESRDM